MSQLRWLAVMATSALALTVVSTTVQGSEQPLPGQEGINAPQSFDPPDDPPPPASEPDGVEEQPVTDNSVPPPSDPLSGTDIDVAHNQVNGPTTDDNAEAAPRLGLDLQLRSDGYSRAHGATRYETAAENAMMVCGNGCDDVFIASGTAYPDGIAMAALAVHKRGAVLLVSANGVPAATTNALRKIKPKRISIAGGTSVVSASVERALGAHVTNAPTRYHGANRYETAARIAKAFDNPTEVFLTTGENWPDALAAASIAGNRGAPLVLARSGSLESASRATLARIKPRSITIAGGTWGKALPEIKSVAGTNNVSVRSGNDRYQTAVELAKLVTSTPRQAVFATGADFADAITGATVAGAAAVPMILLRKTCRPDAVGDYAGTIPGGHISGGTSVVANGAIARACPRSGPSVVSPAPALEGDWMDEFRAILDGMGGQRVALRELTGTCGGVAAAGCASSLGFISISQSQKSTSTAWKHHLVAHEYAHIITFRQWTNLNASPDFKQLFPGNNYELLANCMATVKGYGWRDYRCSTNQINYASRVWAGNA